MIHIVTHAYAETLPQYAVFLRAQLSSLLLYKPTIPFRITICYYEEDRAVVEVMNDLRGFLKGQLFGMEMNKGELFRRCIGRNRVALSQQADLVWFTDADHLFGPDCLDSLWGAWLDISSSKERVSLMWPKEILLQSYHTDGDTYFRKHLKDRGLLSPLSQIGGFNPKQYGKAIGGVQIVSGVFARTHGYLNSHKRMQTPVSPDKPFPSFVDDVKFRKFCESKGKTKPVDIQALYRFRHTEITYK